MAAGAADAPLPRVAPADLAKLQPADFADDELDLPFCLAHFHQVANGMDESGPTRGYLRLKARAEEALRRPIVATLTRPNLYEHGKSYTNQCGNVWGGGPAHFSCRPDAALREPWERRFHQSRGFGACRRDGVGGNPHSQNQPSTRHPMKTTALAKRLVAFCRKAQWEAAHRALYADNAVSIEPAATPNFPKVTKGLPKIIKKGHKFVAMVEKMHSLKVSAPLVAGDVIACTMTMDVTMKGMGRFKMAELCVYQVKDGRIVSEQFFF